MLKIIPIQLKPIITNTKLSNNPEIEKEIRTYFDVVDANCSIDEAQIICFAENHVRFDGAIPTQLLLNKLAKDGDFYILEGNDHNQLVLGGDPRTVLLTKNITLKGWDKKDNKARYDFFRERISHFEEKILSRRADLRKNKQLKERFNDCINSLQSLDEFKNDNKEVNGLIDELASYKKQEQDWIIKDRNRKLIETFKANLKADKRTFALMGAAHYRPNINYINRWYSDIFKTLNKQEIANFLKTSMNGTAELRDFLKQYKIVVLIPKYDCLPTLPKVDIKEELLDEKIEEITDGETNTKYLDQAVKNLYQLKKDPDVKDHSLINLISMYNLEQSLQLLIQKGVDIDSKGKKNGNTPLHLSARFFNKEVLKILLENGAQVNDSNAHAQTPLHLAVSEKSKSLSYILPETLENKRLENKANQLECIDLLLKHQANPNKRDKNGLTPLSLGLRYTADYQVIKILLEHKANPNISNNDGLTPLFIAITYKNKPEIIELLIKHGAKVNEKGKGLLPLELAIRENNLAVVKILLEHGATVKEELIELAQKCSQPLITEMLRAQLKID